MQNLEPSIEDRKKFDIDLKYGKVRENKIAEMFQNKKIEVFNNGNHIRDFTYVDDIV